MLFNQPLISVIVNCHNGEKYLNEALDSIFEQTYSNFEIIFWDNASSDNSSAIAKRYMSNDSRLRYFYAQTTAPLGEARVLAINESNGEFLSFLDCDDVWLPDKLEKQLNFFLNSSEEVGFVYSRCMVISEEGKNLGEINNTNEKLPMGEIFHELVKKNFIPFVSVLVNKSKYHEVGGFPSEYKNSTDYDLFLKLSYKYSVLAINEVLCKYREHGANRSHNQYVIGAQEAIMSVQKFLPDPRALEGMKYQHTELIIAYLKDGGYLTALTYFIKKGNLSIFFKRVIKKIKPNVF